jgi:predicted Zn finger-like uncharacterized protein
MQTKCPHCSTMQTIQDNMLGTNIRCEECRGMFRAMELLYLKQLETDNAIPEYTHFGPGWWLTVIAILFLFLSVGALLARQWMLAFSLFTGAAVPFAFSQIVNYLGHIASLLRYSLARDAKKAEAKS